MRRVLIIGASGGIGRAVVTALRVQGIVVVELSRSTDGLEICDEINVAQQFSELDGHFDMIFVATGALEIEGQGPEKTLMSVTPSSLRRQFNVNAIGPVILLKHALRLLPRDQRAVFAVLSARVGSISDNRLGGWYSYRAAKAALNQLIHTASIETARTHPKLICAVLHPGTVQTALTKKYAGGNPSVPAEEAADNLLRVIGGLREKDSGAFFDWAGHKIEW
ncbi:SDR family NAD(P)-dependent oxidoreductase [Pseudohalocynthiibacter aestuariivivens]|jgi:NAD(P)-dependent dehydrogenase (short-subunit alcohol dehydrogenase family)|uniref:SDR family NAD(P)-dependent oxidoreductase n=1 Tax=Pseudohalocynthiibacter aestuariivivens TaxID=1591409 RepID=A0ABV5JJ31_9RHOB|nr:MULTISPECIES: SDR family NAD(P)-dependent oxidoreductase [Pseudohalocynthiibacter]MBS9718467.1 SDR family NAD(P)-dependent oxidoreductase [Pseudohalocynthiibacter aestuariivivens]MCK0104064.1 SDR family NAD(P)-dependent oxidoreductase [Pseudohalocynthiibacter sp. F2068]